MEGVRVGGENLLSNVKGLKGPFGCLNRAQCGISWGRMGSAKFCWHAARNTRWIASCSDDRSRPTKS